MPRGKVPHVLPTHTRNCADGAQEAIRIVGDVDLLREVLRRAALICPEALEEAAREGRERIAAIRRGDWRQ